MVQRRTVGWLATRAEKHVGIDVGERLRQVVMPVKAEFWITTGVVPAGSRSQG